MLEQPLHEVDLRLGERRVEPDAARRDALPCSRLDHVAARRARDVRVVEHDPRDAAGQRAVEGFRELTQRPAALVAIQPDVAARDVLLATRLLPAPGMPITSTTSASSRVTARSTGRGRRPQRRRSASDRRRRARGSQRRRPSARSPGVSRRGSGRSPARGRAARRARPPPRLHRVRCRTSTSAA